MSFITHILSTLLLLSAVSLYAQTTDNTYNFGTYHPLHLYEQGNLGLLLSSDKLFDEQKLYKLQAAYTFSQLFYVQAGYENSFLDIEADKEQITKSNFGYGTFGAYYFRKNSKTKKWLFKKLPEKYTDSPGFLFDVALNYGFNQNFSKYQFETYNTRSEIKLNKFTAIISVAYFNRFWGASLALNAAILNFAKGKASIKGPQEINNFFNAINRNAKFPKTYGGNLNVWLGTKQFKIMYSINKDHAFQDRYYFYFFQRSSQRLSLLFNFNVEKNLTGGNEIPE